MDHIYITSTYKRKNHQSNKNCVSLKRYRKKNKKKSNFKIHTVIELEIIISIKTYGVSIPREKATSWLQKMSASDKMTKQKSKRKNVMDIVEVKLKNFSRKT